MKCIHFLFGLMLIFSLSLKSMDEGNNLLKQPLLEQEKQVIVDTVDIPNHESSRDANLVSSQVKETQKTNSFGSTLKSILKKKSKYQD